MLCPNCKTPLSIAERAQIEIDFCPTCRGVWLDRGELDKLIERANAQPPTAATGDGSAAFRPSGPPLPREQLQGDPDWSRHGHRRPHRKRSFLSDIFEFD